MSPHQVFLPSPAHLPEGSEADQCGCGHKALHCRCKGVTYTHSQRGGVSRSVPSPLLTWHSPVRTQGFPGTPVFPPKALRQAFGSQKPPSAQGGHGCDGETFSFSETQIVKSSHRLPRSGPQTGSLQDGWAFSELDQKAAPPSGSQHSEEPPVPHPSTHPWLRTGSVKKGKPGISLGGGPTLRGPRTPCSLWP